MAAQLISSEYSRIVASQEQVSSELEGEAVILDVKSGVYYGLNQVGASVWNMIQAPKSIKEIQAALLAEYEVEPEVCERDLMILLEDLAAKGLIKITNEASA
ncbi:MULTISPECIES: PqqD family peptide modification chaperone [unclassified Anabaena]|uniref:PqqD family peptide modification chaperone n=1 Tax=unclassified Anabaena TaxID=2619674 RepID=UPI00082F1A93|nr:MULTISPECIES: PqqD family peptide modification chaperone [unclassified Anabaena]